MKNPVFTFFILLVVVGAVAWWFQYGDNARTDSVERVVVGQGATTVSQTTGQAVPQHILAAPGPSVATESDASIKPVGLHKPNEAPARAVKLNASGLIEIDAAQAARLTENQLEQLEREVETTNRYIRDGIMKFDQNMNLVFDKRTE